MIYDKMKCFLIIASVFTTENMYEAEHEELLDFKRMILNEQRNFIKSLNGLQDQVNTWNLFERSK